MRQVSGGTEEEEEEKEEEEEESGKKHNIKENCSKVSHAPYLISGVFK